MTTHSLDSPPRTVPARSAPAEPAGRRGLRHWVAETFWVADLMVLGLAAFFVLLGAFSPFDSTAVWIALAVMVVLYAGHVFLRWRSRDRATLSAEDRRARERRGF